MSTKDDILKLLPKLKPAELAEVSNAIKALASLSGLKLDNVAQGSQAADDPLLDALAQCLITQGVVPRSNYAARSLTRRDAYKQYKAKRPELDGFIAKLAGSLGTRGNRYLPQICFLCVEVLADMLKRRNIFSVGAMLTQIDKIPEALDASFPGYVESGMFSFVLLNAGKVGK